MYPELTLKLGENIYVLETYTVFMSLSIGIGSALAFIQLRKHMKYSFLFLVGLVINFIFGARILNYFVNNTFYRINNLSLFELKVTGFSFYGGILACIIYILFIRKIFKTNIWHLTDAMILPFGLSFFIMRIGCFLNGCCYGKYTTAFFGVTLPPEQLTTVFGVFSKIVKIHPTQLYEGFGALIGIIFFSLYKKKIKTKGLLTLYYGIYLTSIRWIVLYFRSLAYSREIIYYFYPAVYCLLIITGLILIKKRRSEKHLKSSTYNLRIKADLY